ncbi:PhaM family polyhydroxyalkanoate granule multifunctional regulatory protein [Castellaniella sp.]|uniref:PhaM family polyhydroxyalkanoate granule multifunctional regulatory protein n=1 Tax=Castellaniella sp. TaxID=1955812 RepID=UPI002AFDEAEA|nr:PhaM family polyhydroxyalkanoate granule multifunctional regulatory protein [Castellaniella sp.]
MAQDKNNPFVLPGFGQTGDAAGNPLMAGLDMMRQAWQNLAGGSTLETPAMPSLSPEDLDRRIRELQTVQNWLQLNATMLASTIQGLEIQRSTLKTLQSFAEGAFAGMTPGSQPADAAPSVVGSAAAQAVGDSSQAYTQAASDWWNLVQQQFEQLRDATKASFDTMAESAEAVSPKPKRAPAAKPARQASAAEAPKSTARKPAAAPKAAKASKTAAAPKKRST